MSAETPGYALFVGVPDQSFTKTLAGIVEEKTMTVGFNRAPKQQDVLIDLDLQVVDVQVTAGQAVRSQSPAMVEQFTACLGDLLRAIGK